MSHNNEESHLKVDKMEPSAASPLSPSSTNQINNNTNDNNLNAINNNNNISSNVSDEQNSASTKAKVYKLNDEFSSQQGQRLLNTKPNDNIELNELNSTNNNNNNNININNNSNKYAAKPVGSVPLVSGNDFTQSRAYLIRYKFENILDFNLKFSSPALERLYKKSYLPVTRLQFTQYLFYLILLSICWIIYFSVDQDTSSFKQVGELIRYSLPVEDDQDENKFNSFNLTNLTTATAATTTAGLVNSEKLYEIFNSVFFFSFDSNNYYLIVVIYLAVVTLILIGIFAYTFVAELKESHYRYLENKLQDQEMKTKVDTKKAERDLKEAMEDVIKKEEEYSSLKKLLNIKYGKVSKSRDIYSKIASPLALAVVSCMFGLCFVAFVNPPSSLTQITHFIWFAESLLLFYLIYPFHMGVSVVFGIIFSILFELLAIKRQVNVSSETDDSAISSVYLQSQIIIFLFIKILLHSSIHLIGGYLKMSLQAVKRDTFLKVAHMHKAHLASQKDKEITERMIKSIMPPLFTHVFGKPEEFKKKVNIVHQMRPLFIYPVSNISILFADIVGFTRMSSTKTAEQLVFLLNDLYGRFDRLCEKAGCEKISTLGDCYYCVSGCLNGREDHAKCCVEMGLLMVKEIELFNKTHNVDVNMRVGVHTGNALCGFIGGKRFRFDVWSSDVTLANKMESSGRPGSVHISQDTFEHLKDFGYKTESGDLYSGKQTYFVVREVKRETVADALKQNANATSSALDNSSVSLTQTQHTETLNESASYNESDRKTNIVLNDSSINVENNEEDLLLNAIKDTEFFQPDINLITMRFKSEEERKFQAFLMGLNNSKSAQHNINTSNNTINLNNSNGNQIETPSHRSSKSVWTNPRNTLFLSIIVSFIVNLCASTAYLLTFIVSSMSSCTYRLAPIYKSNLIMILSIFFALILLQSIFLIFYFFQCTKLIGKANKKTCLFDPHPSANLPPPATSLNSRPSLRNEREKNRYVLVRYSLLHVISISLLCLIPAFIISTGLPILCNILKYSLVPLVSLNEESSSILESTRNQDSSISCLDFTDSKESKRLNLFGMYSFFCFVVTLIHFGSFFQLCSLVKTSAALIFALIFGLASFIGIFKHFNVNIVDDPIFLNLLEIVYRNDTSLLSESLLETINFNNTPKFKDIEIISFNLYSNLFLQGFLKENAVILLDLALLILLIFFVNRQSELIQRVSFKCDQNALSKVTYAKEQKDLASWLIEVVLPNHVISHVQEKKQYSRNYDCVGVLFVSLCNFGEFFEESYEGGRELLRVLNEITVDFDRLFDEPKYRNVEKIKSIGSTFMIASGLCENNTNSKEDDDISHLYDLIDFALELSEKLESFNNEAMSVCHFKFKMRMGFNAGPVTAGVIGTERLLYDIWGDTVNVASRMDSTGQAGYLQTPEKVTKLLDGSYKFTYRGPTHIKGKDSMITYFMDPKENQKRNSNF